QERDWIYVQDVAAGLHAMLRRPLAAGETLDLGTGQLTSVADVVRQVYALVNAQQPEGRRGQPLVGALPSRPGEDRRQIANVRKTQEQLGWETAVSLADGLHAYLHSCRQPSSGT
ncbi:MAG: GDP-mannose 4,6-dehydratase, partial [Anaerolineales bacterium]|nr:GDP-mannose 4,6-dehydratase [Anaerolineales bacterium]